MANDYTSLGFTNHNRAHLSLRLAYYPPHCGPCLADAIQGYVSRLLDPLEAGGLGERIFWAMNCDT